MFGEVRWHMYQTRNVEIARRSYKVETGKEATLALCRTDFDVVGEAPILVRSRMGAAGAILVTHEVCVSDWQEASGANQRITKPAKAIAGGKIQVSDAPKRQAGRPAKGGGVCPHCQQRVSNFNDLGFWYGWAEGRTPPYWEELCHYVFQRDEFRCQRCMSRLPQERLTAHHIAPKESGGTDSARNLVTLCKDCHLDTKPIYPDSAN